MIQLSWKGYFQNPDEGLGTTYERFILHRHFEGIERRFRIQNLLEVPSFGMTGVSGINSLWWASRGIPVTLVDDHEERISFVRDVWGRLSLPVRILYCPREQSRFSLEDHSFDMSWNFAALRFVPRPEAIVGEMCRVTRKVILICMPNAGNLFSRMNSRAARRPGKGMDRDPLGALLPVMRNNGWELLEKGYFDIPPWPDIAMKKEDFLRKLGLNRIAGGMEKKKGNSLCILDYFSGKDIGMGKRTLKLDILERAPAFFKRIWAHHHYFLFTPRRIRET